jgi:NAD(P)H-flavin reductase
MHLYWGVRRPDDLYLLDLPGKWEREHPGFRFIPVVSEPQPADGWLGRTGLVHEAILADFPDLAGHEVYVCGSVRMVDAAVQGFLAGGLEEGACFSDAFLPAVQGA